MSYATIDALRESLAAPSPRGAVTRSPEYIAKMMHQIPTATVVDRAAFILERVTGKRVLEFGASGPMHEAVKKVASEYHGVDREVGPGVVKYDLDDVAVQQNDCGRFYAGPALPCVGADIIVCGEVIEHLANPGYFLQRLKAQYNGVPVLITVPNAFCRFQQHHLLTNGVENVNIDHVSWYSYRTLRTLLERYSYAIDTFHWYGGEPYTAEGLIMVAR